MITNSIYFIIISYISKNENVAYPRQAECWHINILKAGAWENQAHSFVNRFEYACRTCGLLRYHSNSKNTGAK